MRIRPATAAAPTGPSFGGAGWVVRQRLGLLLTGTALLAIGAAFVPLAIRTLGQNRLLAWPPATVWLVASATCLPLYGVTYAVLRERAFATLTALAGGSLLLAATYRVGVPLEWGFCATLALAMAYVTLARRLRSDWGDLRWALSATAHGTTVVVLAGLTAAHFAAPVTVPGWGWPLGAVDGDAVRADWWLGTAFFALAGRVDGRRALVHAAAWSLPVAYLLTLTRVPWSGAWYGVCLSLLAALYLLYGR